MEYLKWTEQEIRGLKRKKGISLLLVEVDSEGTVQREVGLDERGDVVHAFPSKRDRRGLFDLSPIDVSDLRGNIASSEFEFYWDKRDEA